MLDEANGRYRQEDKIRSYSASVRCEKDVENLSKIGLNTEEISHSLGLGISFVKSRMARINEVNADRRRFLRTGILPEPDPRERQGYYAILPR